MSHFGKDNGITLSPELQAPVAQNLERISVRETNCVIHWIEIYPVDSAIYLSNNWGQKYCSVKKWLPLHQINNFLNMPKTGIQRCKMISLRTKGKQRSFIIGFGIHCSSLVEKICYLRIRTKMYVRITEQVNARNLALSCVFLFRFSVGIRECTDHKLSEGYPIKFLCKKK